MHSAANCIITNLNIEDQREHEGSTSIKFTMFPRKAVSFELLNRPYLMDEQLHPNTTHYSFKEAITLLNTTLKLLYQCTPAMA